MPRIIEISVLPKVASSRESIKNYLKEKKKVKGAFLDDFKLLKRSIDARKSPVKINLRIELSPSALENELGEMSNSLAFKNVESFPVAYIIGCGPAGLFAALKLIDLDIKPVIIERGKKVRERRRDIAALNKEHIVNPDSNYCFGEGGAGTFSDGKLYTRSKKRGDVQKVLDTFISFGADENIGIDAHPHIGTNKLPVVISAIRDFILECGGEIHFDHRLTGIEVDNSKLKSITLSTGETIETNHLILATGHSARDIYKLLHKQRVQIEFKPFALGVRIEHPQSLIDSIQYKMEKRGEYLPAASYSIVRQINEKGVFSFCMCPGGIIAPCATEKDEVVTNGWSPSKRNMAWANSGIVVEINANDIPIDHALSGIEFQKKIEHKAFEMAGKSQKVPAQRLTDFLKGKRSISIPKSSYLPGTSSAELSELLPDFITETLKGGFKAFGKSLHGFITDEAVIHAPESRTSSPVRIPRDKDSLEHIQIKGLYPCGEGAGYAGGIMSAAIDGQKCAIACAHKIKNG